MKIFLLNIQVDVEVMVEKDISQPGEPVLISTPPVCHKCLKTKAEAEHESRLNYTNQVNLIFKEVEGHTVRIGSVLLSISFWQY